jgi:hypothetical protein
MRALPDSSRAAVAATITAGITFRLNQLIQMVGNAGDGRTATTIASFFMHG